MCELCKAQAEAGMEGSSQETVGADRIAEFLAHYRPHFAEHDTGLLLAGFLQLLRERIEERSKVTPENAHLFTGTEIRIMLPQMMGCTLILEPLEQTPDGHIYARGHLLEMAMAEKQKAKKVQ